MNKRFIGYITIIFAIILSSSAAYISIIGWGKLFSGNSVLVMIVMGVLEASKIIVSLYLHKVFNSVNKITFSSILKSIFSIESYLIIGVIVTMFLTSIGIYGFLSSSYKQSFNGLTKHEGRIKIIENKIKFFNDNKKDIEDLIEYKKKRIDQLVSIRVQQEARLDSLIKNNHWYNVKKTREDINNANNEIKNLNVEIGNLNNNLLSLQDSINRYNEKKIDIETSTNETYEIGPILYMAKLLNKDLDDIVNYVIFLIIFIFDPMAISLLIVSDKILSEKVVNVNKVEPKVFNYQKKEENNNITNDNRGFSTNIPNPKKVVERKLGTNKKIVDDNTIIFKKKR
jgi:hypothetical protein